MHARRGSRGLTPAPAAVVIEGRATATGGAAGFAVADGQPANRRVRTSHHEILVSSVLIGGSSLLALLIGLVRTKAMAMLLGPAGFGLFGMYLAIADLTRSTAEMVSGAIYNTIMAKVRDGAIERDEEFLSELVYMAMMPYLGARAAEDELLVQPLH